MEYIRGATSLAAAVTAILKIVVEQQTNDVLKSPELLNELVGELVLSAGVPAGPVVQVVSEVFYRAPETVRRFVLLLEGRPSNTDSVIYAEKQRGQYWGVMRSISFVYEGETMITGILVYSRGNPASAYVNKVEGGVNNKKVTVFVSLGFLPPNPVDIEIVVFGRQKSIEMSDMD